MDKETSVNANKVGWGLLCLAIGGILGILAWNINLFK